MRQILRIASLAILASIGAAQAADMAPPQVPMFGAQPGASWRLFDEARLGVFAHDPDSPEGGSADINGEILSSRLPLIDPSSNWAWLSPRLHLGGTVNTVGDTSHAYAGLTWTADVTQRFFLEGSFGGAIHNGDTGPDAPLDQSELGCSPLFRESGSIGYRVTSSWSVMASIEHLSNAGLCDANRGLTNYGVRVGYRF
jgi:hypothetical protein